MKIEGGGGAVGPRRLHPLRSFGDRVGLAETLSAVGLWTGESASVHDLGTG